VSKARILSRCFHTLIPNHSISLYGLRGRVPRQFRTSLQHLRFVEGIFMSSNLTTERMSSYRVVHSQEILCSVWLLDKAGERLYCAAARAFRPTNCGDERNSHRPAARVMHGCVSWGAGLRCRHRLGSSLGESPPFGQELWTAGLLVHNHHVP
jgi:hypothetical protein